MREIKFRAYVNNAIHGKGIFPVKSIHFNPFVCEVVMGDEIVNFFDFDDIALLEYTGLKDKNGKEIYEGDILEITELSGRIGGCKVGRYTVNFDAGAYVAGDLYVGGGYKLGLVAHRAKVIGNIYEHPHLLGGGEE